MRDEDDDNDNEDGDVIIITTHSNMQLGRLRSRENNLYYSFKIFPRFRLVKTTRTNHHN